MHDCKIHEYAFRREAEDCPFLFRIKKERIQPGPATLLMKDRVCYCCTPLCSRAGGSGGPLGETPSGSEAVAGGIRTASEWVQKS